MLFLITPGDPAGIGPEITWKTFTGSLAQKLLREGCFIAAVGSHESLELAGAKTVRLPDRLISHQALLSEIQKINRCCPKSLPVIAAPSVSTGFWGRLKKNNLNLCGFQSGWSIARAVSMIKASPKTRALITGPISKERLLQGGYLYPGHTEFLGFLNNSPPSRPPLMMLSNKEMRVVLATVHEPISSVSRLITKEKLRYVITQTAQYLKRLELKGLPKIAVLGLNPHAGENGLLGDEERLVIAPAVRSFSKNSQFLVAGPFPADTFFATQVIKPRKERFDAVIAMYHDQGLAPIKLIDFDKTVNITLGLKFIRTSVDHGTGFDIAGKGVAKPDSMIAALELAAHELGRIK